MFNILYADLNSLAASCIFILNGQCPLSISLNLNAELTARKGRRVLAKLAHLHFINVLAYFIKSFFNFNRLHEHYGIGFRSCHTATTDGHSSFFFKMIIGFTFTVDKMYKMRCEYAHWGNKLAKKKKSSRTNFMQARRVLGHIIFTKQEAFLFYGRRGLS